MQYSSFTRFDSLPGLCQAVQTGFDILLVELDLFVVHFGFLVQPVNRKLESVQFLLALLAVAVLVADVLETDTISKYTNANTDTPTLAHMHAHTHPPHMHAHVRGESEGREEENSMQ